MVLIKIMANKTVKRRQKWEEAKRPRKKRPKTFKTEGAAKIYAEKNKIEKYEIVNIRKEDAKDKKLKIVSV